MAATENCSGGDGYPNQSACEETNRRLNSGDQLEIVRLYGLNSRDSFSLDPTQEFLRDDIELRSELLIHKEDLCFRKDATAPFIPKRGTNLVLVLN